jgi:tetratricopeptide (TPR) repeat protein
MGLSSNCAAGLLAIAMFVAPSAAAVSPNVEACLKADDFRDGSKAVELCRALEGEQGLEDKTKAKIFEKEGDAYYWAARVVDAGQLYDKALALDPLSIELKSKKGRVLRRLGNYEGAYQLLSDVLGEDPKNGSALLNLALILDSSGQPEQARSAMLQSIEADPDYLVTRNSLADLYVSRFGDTASALKEYDFILAKGEAIANKTRYLGDGRILSRDFYLQTLLDKVDLLRRAGKLDEAEKLLAPMLKKYPREFMTKIKAASIARNRRNFKEALKLIRSANSLCTSQIDNTLCSNGLVDNMELLYLDKQYQKSLDASNEILQGFFLPETKAFALYHRGATKKQLGDLKGAQADVENAMSQDRQIKAMAMTQVLQAGYYEGQQDDPFSDKVSNALEACMIDPECFS